MIGVIAIIVGVILADQISKLLVLEYLYKDSVTVIKGILDFTYVENRGMAFGLLSDQRWVFLLLSTVGILLMGFYLFRYTERWLPRVALSLIVAGGIGNMIDRVRLGFVVDFIDFCAFPRIWYWVFNVADAAVCVGGALFVFSLILDIARDAKGKKPPEGGAAPTADREGETHG
ncbi:MAG: signal peptidase II [Ruminococcaceae bacterium]|nr:signal peptidase II [Oscillospiraceae bacterium]